MPDNSFCPRRGAFQYQCQGCVKEWTGMQNVAYSAQPKLTTEKVIAELKLLRKCSERRFKYADMCALVDQLPNPDPPRVDVVEECAKAYGMHLRIDPFERTKAAIRRYLELRGLPADPELGDSNGR